MNSPLELEHHVQRIITQQEQNGVLFNTARARFYRLVLQEKQINLYKKIRPLLSLEVQRPYNTSINKPFLKAGGYNNSVKAWYEGNPSEIECVSGPFTRVSFEEPDLGKRNKLIAQLLQLGWVPKAFTEKGSPKLSVDGEPCPSLLSISSSIGKWIGEWYTYRHRESQIKGLISKVRPDGRLQAGAITIGTPTFRFRHTVVVNIPKAAKQVLFGRQMRSLFTVDWENKYRLVGHDASGLELRMLAHYINDDTFTSEVVEGDIHTKNQRDAGLPNRDAAKTFIYAFNYGAGDAKIGSIIGGNRAAGKRIKQKFLGNNPKLAEFIARTERAGKRGYLLGLDGRKLHLRRDKFTGQIQTHKALNTLLQAAGAIVMKYSMYYLDKWVQEYKLDVKKVIDMHDEGQAEVHYRDVEMYKLLAVQSIRQAGIHLGLNVPLDGEAKVGTNWAQTH